MLSIGLMSGTSMDGIEAALIKTDGSYQLLETLSHISLPYDPLFKILLKSAEYAVRASQGDLKVASEQYRTFLDAYLKESLHQKNPQKETVTLAQIIQHSTELHAQAVHHLLQKTGLSPKEVAVVGYHGQTLFHRPKEGISIIAGDGQRLADTVQIPVVNDFRSNDIKWGGQGAPLAPLYHYALLMRDHLVPGAVINCGGIANVSLILNDNELAVTGFDTGPGNALIDTLVRQRTRGQEHLDLNGQYGLKGRVDKAVLQALMEKSLWVAGENYLLKKPPKSLDYGDILLIPELDNLSLEDACRTLEAFTAETIVRSLEKSLPKRFILAGGGWYNPVIFNELCERLHLIDPTIVVSKAEEVGWNNDAIEAQMFAYFAVRSIQNKVLSLPGTTGVSYPVSGGQYYCPQIFP